MNEECYKNKCAQSMSGAKPGDIISLRDITCNSSFVILCSEQSPSWSLCILSCWHLAVTQSIMQIKMFKCSLLLGVGLCWKCQKSYRSWRVQAVQWVYSCVQLCTVVYSCVQWPNTPSSVVTTICWPAATESESMKESQPYTAHCGLLPPLGRHVTTPTSGWWWWGPRPACVIMWWCPWWRYKDWS